MIIASQLRKFRALIYKRNISLDRRTVLWLLLMSPGGYESRPLTELNVTARVPFRFSSTKGGLHHLDELRNVNDIVNNSARLKLCPPGNYREAHDIRAWE